MRQHHWSGSMIFFLQSHHTALLPVMAEGPRYIVLPKELADCKPKENALGTAGFVYSPLLCTIAGRGGELRCRLRLCMFTRTGLMVPVRTLILLLHRRSP